jgi:hypothetical protein
MQRNEIGVDPQSLEFAGPPETVALLEDVQAVRMVDSGPGADKTFVLACPCRNRTTLRRRDGC